MAEDWRCNPDIVKIYVGALNQDSTDENGMTNYFSQFGTVTECVLIRDNQNDGKSKGFGFVSFSTPEEVDKLLEKAHTLDGKTLQVRRAIPRDDPNPLAHVRTKKLFVGGLTEEATEEDIKCILEPMANSAIESIKLMRDRNTQKFKGYAFVTFCSDHPVDKLFIIRHATIKNKRVELKKAEDLSGGATSIRGGRGGRGGPRGGGRGRAGAGAGAGGGYGGSGYGGGSSGGYGRGYPRGTSYSGNYEGYEGYATAGAYDSGYNYGGGDDYNNGYGSYGSYGGGYSMGQYGSDPSGYGPSRRGRGGARGRGGYTSPY